MVKKSTLLSFHRIKEFILAVYTGQFGVVYKGCLIDVGSSGYETKKVVAVKTLKGKLMHYSPSDNVIGMYKCVITSEKCT